VVIFHPQGHVDEGHKVLRCNETRKRENRICLNEDLKKKINKGKIFFLGEKIMMRRLNLYRNDKRGGCKKQKLLKTCGVALVVLTAMMKKGFAEIQ
jgi:hypothetical protein